MSNASAIAAVTATIRNILQQSIQSEGTVTTLPLDKANVETDANRLNLFLYQTTVNAAFRNADMPGQAKPSESSHPPLALNLHYLITAYGDNSQVPKDHKLLGRAMSALHDHPLLAKSEIQGSVPDEDLHNQVERVRITPQPMSLDDMSKLWAAFQANYRVSAAYQAAVVLIQSKRATTTPLPVLSVGRDKRGPSIEASLLVPFPTITRFSIPGQRMAAHLADSLVIEGHHLDGTAHSAILRHPRLASPLVRPCFPDANAADRRLQLTIPDQPDTFPAGIYSLHVTLMRPEETERRTSNECPFSLAPQIVTNPPPSAIRSGDKITITLRCKPTALKDQRVTLLLGSREIVANTRAGPANDLVFEVKDKPSGTIPAGQHVIRLRIDGVESNLIDRSTDPPMFDPTQVLTIP